MAYPKTLQGDQWNLIKSIDGITTKKMRVAKALLSFLNVKVVRLASRVVHPF